MDQVQLEIQHQGQACEGTVWIVSRRAAGTGATVSWHAQLMAQGQVLREVGLRHSELEAGALLLPPTALAKLLLDQTLAAG